MTEVQTPAFARSIERTIFGGLLGLMSATFVIRFLLLTQDLPTGGLIGISVLGALIGSVLGLYKNSSVSSLGKRVNEWSSWLKSMGLKAMLGLLAIAALIGVVMVLTGSYTMLGRIAGTVIATSIAAGFLWGMSAIADRKSTYEAGLLGMAATLTVYFLGVPIIWGLGVREEEVLYSSFVIGFCTPLAMFFLAVKNVDQVWVAARLGLVLEMGAIAALLTGAWHSGNWQETEAWWMTGLWSTALAFLCFGCLCGLTRLVVDWRWLGVAASLITWAIVMVSTWSYSEPHQQLLTLAVSISLVFAHASLVALAPLKPFQVWLRWLTIATAISACIFVNLEVFLQPGSGLSFFGRAAGASLIVGACGSLALVVLASLNRMSVKPAPAAPASSTYGQVTLICPRCDESISADAGAIECTKCRLRMTLTIEESPAFQATS